MTWRGSTNAGAAAGNVGGIGSVTPLLNRDWMDFLCALIFRGARFLVVAGHDGDEDSGQRRAEDLELLVEPTHDNARALREALMEVGVEPPAHVLARPGAIFMPGRVAWRIEIFTSIGGVNFRTACERRAEVAFAASPLPVIDRAALLATSGAESRTLARG